MSSQNVHRRTGKRLAVLPAFALTGTGLIGSILIGVIGCGAPSETPVASTSSGTPGAKISPPVVPGQLPGDPIEVPYLTDLTQPGPGPTGRLTTVPATLSSDAEFHLVQAPSGKVEIIPTPEPDPAPGEKMPGENDPKIPKMTTPAGGSGDTTRVEPPSIPDGATAPVDYRDWPVPDLALVVTGRQHGYIEPCGCTGLDRQKGGMARRFTLMENLRELGWPLVPVDVGDQVRRFGRQAEIKLQQTARALQEMNYQAVGFGPDDLRLGVGELLSVAAAESPDKALYVSANVVLIDASLMPQTKVVQQHGHRVGLTSILDPETVDVELGDDIAVSDMESAARKALDQMNDQEATFKVMLFFGSEENAQSLMVAVPGFDLIAVAGGYGEPTYQPLPIQNSTTQLIVTGNKGMYAGLVGLYADQPYKYARVALTHEFTDAPEMRQLMADYQEQLRALGLDGLGLLPPVPHSSGQKFVGSRVCGECHTNAMDVWESSMHAEATEHIVKPPQERGDVARHFDPECISCHVTGWNPQEYFPYESGYLSLEPSAHLHGNGCENCHGPGSEHVAAEREGSGVTEDVRDQLRDAIKLPLEQAREKCMTCHDLDNSPDFHEPDAFEDIYWPEVEHYGTD